MDADTISKLIISALPGAEVTVSSDDNIHFQATVSYAGFRGKTKVAQHRMVYAPLQESFASSLHALQLTTIIAGENT
ncbi:MAG: BolA/IbaG family iron-sulfur metabolism protein [Pseudomonadota bacterium]|nr:BolA/IbaG family iron-sulfur metabolism protein [Pseudomonadota bacterium]